MTDLKLIEIAKEALKNSYSPYSKYAVGAALLCSDGTIYKGTNIENASYPVGLCAERAAFAAAISDGKRDFEKIAIVNDKGTYCPPCGMCRQFIKEFCSPNFEILLEKENMIVGHTIFELLPCSFELEHDV